MIFTMKDTLYSQDNELDIHVHVHVLHYNILYSGYFRNEFN